MVPVLVTLAVSFVTLTYLVLSRVQSATVNAGRTIESRLLRDSTDVDVVASAIEGMSDVTPSEFQVSVSSLLNRVGAIRGIWLSERVERAPSVADGVFTLPGDARFTPGAFTIVRVEPKTPENMALIGRPIDDVVRPLQPREPDEEIPLRSFAASTDRFGAWFGDSLFVKRAIRLAPEFAEPSAEDVPGTSVRGYMVARLDPAVEAATVSTEWAEARVGEPGRVDTTTGLWRLAMPLEFKRVRLEGVLVASILPRGGEVLFASLMGISVGAMVYLGIAAVSSRRRHLRDLRERLEIATNGAGIGVWDIALSDGRSFFSDVLYRMLGYEPGAFRASEEAWCGLVHPDDREAAERARARHLRGDEELYAHEHRVRCADGSWLWVRAVGKVIETDRDGEPSRMIGVHINTEDLHSAIEEAHAASRAKSDFLANMSHEIRTPMTAILGFADILVSEEGLADEGAQAVRSIRTNADHLLSIINDILDVSKVEAGRMTVEHIPTHPEEIVNGGVDLINARAVAKGISLSARFEGPIPETILSDPTRLRQILVNLVGNAVKFTELGGVEIKVEHDPGSGLLRFRVADTGIGMTEEQVEAASRFEAFSQADESMARRFGGTGLGLRISNAFAHLLGGALEIASVHGEGSTFSLSVATGDIAAVRLISPQLGKERAHERPASSSVESSERSAPVRLDGRRILLAEDGPDNQRLITFHLRKAGVEPVVCENGLEAIRTYEETPPDERPELILMDMQMPELDGYEATRRLRNAGVQIPVIAITAHAMSGDREKCIEAGCDDYLTKPIDKQRLLACIRDWLERHGVRRAA